MPIWQTQPPPPGWFGAQLHILRWRDALPAWRAADGRVAGWQGGRETTVRRRQATIIPWHHAIVAPWVTGGAMA